MTQYNITLDSEDVQGLFSSDKGMTALMEKVTNQILDQQAMEQLGAGKYERTEFRQGYRAGYRSRMLRTRVGRLELMVPRLRDGCFDTELYGDPLAAWNRGMLSLMRRHEKNLRPEQVEKLERYFAGRPDIGAIYHFKQELCTMLLRKTCCENTCRKMLPVLLDKVDQLRNSGLEHMERLGNTLHDWIEEIVCMWRYTRNNGVTEGFHNKMKMIVRRAYGFRNFENYRLRVRALCA